MHDHAAHGDAVVETESAPFIANLGFALGIIAVILEAHASSWRPRRS